jgi:nucleoside-diphosphate-sugar epimerase
MPSILLFGATGLMGSHLVTALKKAYATIPLTIYIRNTDDETKSYLTSAVGVDRIVNGDFSELAKISQLAAEHEVVINCGSSWDVPLSQAIIAGLKQRLEQGKSKASLIHISGTGNFIDHRKDGKYNGHPEGDGKYWNVSIQETSSRCV